MAESDDRIEQELALLRKVFPDLVHCEDSNWVLLPKYELPDIWAEAETAVAVLFPPGFPGNGPYGFHVSPPPTLLDGGQPKNATMSEEPPLSGEWMKFSWSLPEWRASEDVRTGHNMLNFVLTIRKRLEEGA